MTVLGASASNRVPLQTCSFAPPLSVVTVTAGPAGDRETAGDGAGAADGGQAGQEPADGLQVEEEQINQVDQEEVEVEIEIDDEGAAVRADHRFPGLGGLPAALDLDGDGRPELVFRHPLPNGRERLRVVLLR